MWDRSFTICGFMWWFGVSASALRYRIVTPGIAAKITSRIAANTTRDSLESPRSRFVPFEEAAMLLYRVLRTLPWTVCILVWAAGPSLAFGLTFTDDPLVPRITTIKVVLYRTRFPGH